MSGDSQGRSWRARLSRVLGNGGEPAVQNLNGADAASFALRVEAFDRMRVNDVMVPRADIIGVEIGTPLDELARLFADAAHSRLPIYRETLDDPVGMAHIKDVIGHLAPGEDGQRPAGWTESRILPAIRRPLLFAPPSMRATDLLLRMQTRRMHLALVVDEYGGTDGLVTLEDLLEPIVGDIEDEHDEADAPAIRAKGPGLWDVEARTPIEEFEQAAGCTLSDEETDDDIETLGGLVFTLAGRIPERGEVIPHADAGVEFEVLDADPRKIKRLRVRLPADREPGDERGPDDIA
ncbi:hemolysin family protein [Hyphobacterium marinum]|uniref:Hemolysin family protein n=1 Tax=Hyphobacterium marinum TaxID=3116574 RepID=A0ABU7LV54_9PROT|nr:hemolysin family protein [Hyphobacterium sp. Y6023]MEE2565443.1 hemolysin family protein [Hyphobacterium sp. Y6023]